MLYHCKEILINKTEFHKILTRQSGLISSDTPLDTAYLDNFLYLSSFGSVKALLEL